MAQVGRLQGKRILITAGASGMGLAGAELFIREGATICVVDRDRQSTERVIDDMCAAGGTATGIVADLLVPGEAKRIITGAVAAMGGLDGVWLHAGMPSPHGIENLDEAAVKRCLDLNIGAALMSASEAVPHLRKSVAGSILFTASISGLVGSRLSPVYSVAKFGIVGLTKSLALTLGPEGIRVNVLCPGITETPMMHDFMGDTARARYVEAIPLGRIGQPSEMAAPALFLMSDEASYVTGLAMPVDGGFTAG